MHVRNGRPLSLALLLRARRRSAALALPLLALLAACQTSPRPPAPTDGSAPARFVRTPAMIDGQALPFDELWPLLAESGGETALREAVLDRLVAIELRSRGLAAGAREIDAERAILLESLSPDGATAARLLEELRDRDRLGPARFEALLRRNASMRLLVRDEVSLAEDALLVAHDMLAGPARQVRIVAAPSLVEAERAIARVRGGSAFADVAIEVSTDASAARGGLLEPFTRRDPTYPEALRGAVFSLAPGELTAPILLPQGYVVAMLVRERPGSGAPIASMRPQLERAVRLTQERILMDQLARRLMSSARVTVFDENLSWAWGRRK
ncbi:MAG TPA: peptidylprolyl isomerase [Phycisphaerales bacterium]|nr:peptidylprolyl isomerase [Phycisphaerales bacterium]HMP36933.1 peptidylprolyl isomerase [Phycisphaerales bacterium]